MRVVPIPFVDPAAAFAPFAGEPWAMLLDGASPGTERGRFAYIAVRPFRTLLAPDPGADGDPFATLGGLLAEHRRPRIPAPVPFCGGVVGFLGYELGRFLERAPARHPVPPGQPDLALGFYDVIAAFDMRKRRAWVFAGLPQSYPDADALAAGIAAAPPLGPVPQAPSGPAWRPELTRADYLDRVARAIGYIRAGDIFQMNFTQRFLLDRPGSLPGSLTDFEIYRRLRTLNPAPFAAFLRCGDGFTIASASPERFLSLEEGGRIEARPIKGTAKRGAHPALDEAAADALAASPKDRAENLMIVDLLRNDIGRVALPGSVKVPVLYGIESFASLHHLVSVVEGRLNPGLGPVDLLRAAFPGGSVTGAPKVRAMEIIDELEPAPRGPYCGCIAWIGFDGAMDSSIVIRALTLTERTVTAQAGGAIVADSDPALEYEEMLAKARPALQALRDPVACDPVAIRL